MVEKPGNTLDSQNSETSLPAIWKTVFNIRPLIEPTPLSRALLIE